MENIFYSSIKEFKTQSTTINSTKSIVPFSNFHIFVGFSDGYWVLFDSLANKIINEGKISGDPNKCLTLFHSVRALDENTIIFVNADHCQLSALNPYTGELHKKWKHKVPTIEALPKEKRSDVQKVDKAFAGLDIQVLKKSQKVGVLETVPTVNGENQYLVTVFNEDKLECQLKYSNLERNPMRLRPGDDENIFILYSLKPREGKLYMLDTREKFEEFRIFNIEPAPGIYFALYPWGEGEIVLFGNPDRGGKPSQIVYNFFHRESTVIPMNCYNEGTTLKSVFSADPVRKRALLMESNKDGVYLSIWNASFNRVEFAREAEYAKQIVSSTSNEYFVEYNNNQVQKATTMKLVVSRLVTKKMFFIHLMKHAIYNNKRLIEVHGKADVLRDVANMLSFIV